MIDSVLRPKTSITKKEGNVINTYSGLVLKQKKLTLTPCMLNTFAELKFLNYGNRAAV